MATLQEEMRALWVRKQAAEKAARKLAALRAAKVEAEIRLARSKRKAAEKAARKLNSGLADATTIELALLWGIEE